MEKRTLNRHVLLSFPIAAFVLASLLIAQAGLGSREKSPPNTAPSPATMPTAKPGSTQSSGDSLLRERIDRAIDESDLTQARWGLFVMSMNDGRVVYARNSDKLFTPASNMKVYTTAVALDSLSADYRWRTSVYADKQPDNGIVEGDLTLYGRGAPDLRSTRKGEAPSLDQLADQVYQFGVRHVRGNVVGDESYFRGELYGLGWQWNDLQWYFGAEPSALTVDENSFELTISPANKSGAAAGVAINRNTGFVHLTNNTTTAERDVTTTIGINRGLTDNEVRVWGEFPVSGRAFSAFLSIHNPALWAATLFKQALIARGIKVDGEPRSRDFRVAETDKFDPQKAIELAHQDSETLGEIVRKTNKESNNLFAELLLRTLGKERGPSVPDPDPRKNRSRGDDEAGTAVVKSWLDHADIRTRGLAIRDGSGLSRLDLVTPESTARLLAAIARTNSASVFHDSLPIAGRDGTLGGRLKREVGRIFAKTGTLTYTHSLSGYADTKNDEVLVFSIFCNDVTDASDAARVIDEIAGLLAEFGPPK